MTAGKQHFGRFFFQLPRFKVLNCVSFQLLSPSFLPNKCWGAEGNADFACATVPWGVSFKGAQTGRFFAVGSENMLCWATVYKQTVKVTHHLSVIQLKSSVCCVKIQTNLSKPATWNPNSTKLALAAAIAAMDRLRSLATLNQPLSCQVGCSFS